MSGSGWGTMDSAMAETTEAVPGVPPVGSVVGGTYRIREVIARGGMGCLLRAEHELLGQDVAIKFVLDRAGDSGRTRLLREARAMRSLTCDHVVRVFDLGLHEGAPYIVMELLEGSDLHAKVQAHGPLLVEDAVDAIIEAGVAVAEAHALGIVHRDLKPSNLFCAVTRQRELLKVLDFGISKVPEPDRLDDAHATREDVVLGTPHFMSPEQLRNPAKIDARADVWALGVTLFYLLSGELPFDGETRREVTAAVFADPPRPLRSLKPDVPPELVTVVESCLHKRPRERTATVAALVEALVPFASKRGTDAAAPVLSAPSPAVETEPLPSEETTLGASVNSVETDGPTAVTTEGGVASTLASVEETSPSTLGSIPGLTVDRGPRVAGALMIMAVVAGGIWLSNDDAPQSSEAAPPPKTPQATSQVMTTASSVTTTASTKLEEAPPPERSATAPSPPPRPRAATRPATTSRTAPSPAPSIPAPAPTQRAVDIDGIPIIE